VVRKGVVSSISSTFIGLSSSSLVGGLSGSEGGVEGPEVDVQSEKSDPVPESTKTHRAPGTNSRR
jgi:hypothetical protein